MNDIQEWLDSSIVLQTIKTKEQADELKEILMLFKERINQ